MRRLVLFDIDGTLISDDGAAREAYGEALRQVYGLTEIGRQYDFSGKTDPQITHMVLGDAGYTSEEIETRLDELWRWYLDGLASRVSAERVRLLDGVGELLGLLSSDRSLVLALLTGNIEPGARLKLSPHDLNRYFPFGAFGSDSSDREDLPPIAVSRAEEMLSERFEPADVVIIGDSIYDIRCGVPHKATTIGVSTGRTPAAALEAENPDYLFESLKPTEQLLDAIRNGRG
jgi:phosphoglycolate phosphatase